MGNRIEVRDNTNSVVYACEGITYNQTSAMYDEIKSQVLSAIDSLIQSGLSSSPTQVRIRITIL